MREISILMCTHIIYDSIRSKKESGTSTEEAKK